MLPRTAIRCRAEGQGVYVFGQERPAYAMEKGTTVLQAPVLAGGVTDRGSTGREDRAHRGRKKKELKAKLTDLVNQATP